MHDYLIVGGGVIGLSLAYELATQGQSVCLIDRQQVGREASWAGAGTLPPANDLQANSPIDRLAGLSHRLHPQWAQQLRKETNIDTGFIRSGGIYLPEENGEQDSGISPADAIRIELAQYQQRGVEAKLLTSSELRDLEPELAASEGAILLPEESQIRNPWHLKALLAACLLRGVKIVEGAELTEIRQSAGTIDSVMTNLGPWQAEQFCFTTGAWTARILDQFGLAPRLRPIRGQIVLLSCNRAPIQRIVNLGPRYIVPRADGRLLVGATEEDAGFDRRTTAGGVHGLLQMAIQLVPALAGARVERSWAGLRPQTDDRMPYLGPIPDIANGFVAAGHFRSGLQLSAATAVVMGQLMRGERPQIDLASFSLARLAAAETA